MSRWLRLELDLSPLADTYGVPKDVRALQTDKTVQVAHGGQAGIVLQVQGSTNGSAWVDIGAAFTSPTGGFLAVPGAMKQIRIKTSAWTDPVSVSDQVVVQKNADAPITVSSAAPTTSLPRVTIAGFDERAC